MPKTKIRNRNQNQGGEMRGLIKDILIAVVVVMVIMFFFRPTIVKEKSMLPTLEENDYLVMSKQAYTIGDMDRGDIIIFESEIYDEEGKKKLLIKRAIALPGDSIEVTDGQVIVNGKVLEEDYINTDYTYGDVEPMILPEDKIFVMGDNRDVSNDSRSSSVGLVDMSDVEGEAIFRLFPFDKFGTI